MKLKNLFSIQALYSILLLLPLFNASAETSFIFAHGISGSERCGQHYANITGLPFTTFNFPATEESDAGQKNDLTELDKAYKLATKDNDKCILFGLSRGGSAVINFASKKPKNLAAIIAESPFDSLENVVKKGSGIFSSIAMPITKNLIAKKYDKYGLKPIIAVNTIDPTVPVLFFCSKEDQVVPYTCTVNLAEKLQRNRLEWARKTRKKAAPVYLVIFYRGQHANLLIDPKNFGHGMSDEGKIEYSKTNYLRVLNTFLSKYDLPNNKDMVENEKFLDQFDIKKNHFKYISIDY